jgi:hypothetical protein
MKSPTVAVIALSFLTACGEDAIVNPPPPPPPPVPAAVVTATGAGALVLHPSLDSRFAVAMETPMRITETGGGAADWNFARMSIFLRGVEVERTEIGANAIQAAGFGRIAANSNATYRALFRFNSDDFDRIDITLGFTDVRDGRVFTVAVPFNSFPDVAVSFTPAALARSADPL